VRCAACGFMYSSKVMNSETMRGYYQEQFGGQRHLFGQTVNARTNAVVLKQILDLSTVQSWLDVGTGYGLLVRWLRDNCAIAADGVELSSQEAKYARENLGLPIHAKLLSETDLPRAHYDVVSSFEVIEHIADPVAFLTELTEYVRPGGRLVIMTDNFESRPAMKLRGSFPKWIPHTHISHFSPHSLRRCILKVPGLNVEREASYTPWDLIAREWLTPVKPPLPDEEAFDLDMALSTEMGRDYRLYWVRRTINPVWARFHLRKNLEHGALMYAVCRKLF
jgi:SAM-dependent methyltransferase